MAELSVLKGDITRLPVGAIVNAANPQLQGGGGVDGAIHHAGGPAILAACEAIVDEMGPCDPGEAVITNAGELPAGIIIHTVGPIWTEVATGQAVLDATLARCYQRSLELANEHNAKEVAFPNISTGVYGFPKPRAAAVAINATIDWLEQNENHQIHQVVFVCFDQKNYELYEALLTG